MIMVEKENCFQYLIISRTKIEYNKGTKRDPKRRYRYNTSIIF